MQASEKDAAALEVGITERSEHKVNVVSDSRRIDHGEQKEGFRVACHPRSWASTAAHHLVSCGHASPMSITTVPWPDFLDVSCCATLLLYAREQNLGAISAQRADKTYAQARISTAR